MADEAAAQPQVPADGLALSDQSGSRNASARPNVPHKARAAAREVNCGCSTTAEEAALHVASTPEGRDAAASALLPPLTAAEAVAQAEAEGLTLARSYNQSGFRNVSKDPKSKVRPYEAGVWRDGKRVYLGRFATAEEAALHVARTPEGRAAAASALLRPLTATEAVAQAEAQGLTLARSDNQSGFRNVSKQSTNKARPYLAVVRRDGKQVQLRCFATAEEAALHVARMPEVQANVVVARTKALVTAEAKATAQATAQAKAQAMAQAKLAAKVEASRARQEQKRLLEQHREQLEQRRQQMAVQQAQMLRAAAERQRQRQQGGAPRPAAAASTPPAAAAEPATGSTDELIQQVLRGGGGSGCPFRCLGLERDASQEGVRKRYLALALRLHPDKAEHPQAHEAFAALEHAYSRARDAAADAAASPP